MVVGEAHVAGDEVVEFGSENSLETFFAFVGGEMVANHFVVEIEQHQNGLDIRVFLLVHGEIEHDIVRFRDVAAAQSVLKLKNVVFLADPDVFFHRVRSDFAPSGQHHLEFLEFGVNAGQVVADVFAEQFGSLRPQLVVERFGGEIHNPASQVVVFHPDGFEDNAVFGACFQSRAFQFAVFVADDQNGLRTRVFQVSV